MIKVKNASTWIETVYKGAAVPPNKCNAANDGQIGRNMLCSGSIKNKYSLV
jgi:hypothetical protein